MRARLLLAAIVFPAFTLSAQRPGGASVDGKRLGLTPANPGDVGFLERLRSGLFLGALYAEAGGAEVVSAPAGRFNPYVAPMRIAWAAYAQSEGKAYAATAVMDAPDIPATSQPTSSRWSGCWWLWVFTGFRVCR